MFVFATKVEIISKALIGLIDHFIEIIFNNNSWKVKNNGKIHLF